MARRRGAVLTALAFALVSACILAWGCIDTGDEIDNPGGNPQLTILDTKAVNDQGGTVEADGARLDIPPGALNAPALIKIGVVTDPARPAWTRKVIGLGRYFGPGGVMLNKPATVTLPFTALDVQRTQDFQDLRVWCLREEDGSWEYLGTSVVDATNYTVTAKTLHLSTFVITLMPRDSRYCWVEGTVTDFSGAPVSGATVDLLTTGYAAITGDDGTYKIDFLSPGRYSVKATHPRLEATQRTVDLTTGRGTTVDFQMSASAVVTGRLRTIVTSSLDGKAVQGATVSLVDGPTTQGSAVSSRTGIADIAALPPGQYDVRVSRSGLADRLFSGVRLVAGEWTILTAELSQASGGDPGSITGFVRNDVGAAIEGARVEITGGPATHLGWSAITGADGRYELSLLPPSTYRLRATADGYEAKEADGVLVDPGEETVQSFDLVPAGTSDMGSVYGTVRDDDTVPNPVPGATVRVVAGPSGTVNRTTTTGADGSYELADLPPGTYALRVSAAGFDDANASGIVVNAGGRTSYDFLLTRSVVTTGRIRGFVRDAAGNVELAGASVTITAGPSNVGAVATSDSLGVYTLEGLVPGTYNLRASKAGYEDATTAGVAVTAGQDARADFTLVPLG